MEKLKASELSRQKDCEKSLDDYERLMMECENLSAKSFVTEIVQTVSLLLSQFDVALTLDEVIIGGVLNLFLFFVKIVHILIFAFSGGYRSPVHSWKRPYMYGHRHLIIVNSRYKNAVWAYFYVYGRNF